MAGAARLLALACALLLGSAGFFPARAQGFSQDPFALGFSLEPGQVVSPVLLVDRERLFRDSAFGRQISAVLEAERIRLEAQTRRIEEELRQEEQLLTEERATLAPEAFRARADAFDAKVVALRRDRDLAQENLVSEIEKAQAEFLQKISPVLAEILRESGALIILDRRLALLSVSGIDITDQAIARIDAALLKDDTGGDSGADTGGGQAAPAPDAPAGTPGAGDGSGQ